MKKKPTIAGLQRELATAQNDADLWRDQCRVYERQRDQKEAECARATARADELAMRLQSAEQKIEFLKGKIEGMQWMLQQVPGDE